MIRSLISFISIAFVLLTSAAGAEPSAVFQPLGILGAAPGQQAFSTAEGVSADGSLVVGSTTTDAGYRAFRWTVATGMESLGLYAGIGTSSASAVSDDGQTIVGGVTDASGVTVPYRWTEAAGFEILGTLSGSLGATQGVSADGSVATGIFQRSSDGFVQSFRWTQDSGVQLLGAIPAGAPATAMGISADGSVVVGLSGTFGSNGQPFRWTSEGGMESLGPAGPITSSGRSIASDVSADGSVVLGEFLTITPPVSAGTFLWTKETGFEVLSGVPFSTYLPVISGDGRSVGGTATNGAGSYPNGAFLWDRMHGMRLLQDVLVKDLGVNLDGWHLTEVNGFSYDGSIVVGSGLNPQGHSEAFIAFVPETSPLSLLAALSVGSFVFRHFRRRAS